MPLLQIVATTAILLWSIATTHANLTVTHQVDPAWDGGFCYRFMMANNTQTAIPDWQIEFDLPNAQIYTQWNATFSQNNGRHRMTGVWWNAPAQPGLAWDSGFCVNGSGPVSNIQIGASTPTAPMTRNAVCGTAHNAVYPYESTDFETKTQCSVGSPDSTAFPGPGTTLTWICQGVNGGSNTSCRTTRAALPIVVDPVPTPIDGICGTANGKMYTSTRTVYAPDTLCQQGSALADVLFPVAGGLSRWTCMWSHGGSNATCSASRAPMPLVQPKIVHGRCGNANGRSYAATRVQYSPDIQCRSGVSSNTLFPAAGTIVSWICQGSNWGTDATCSARRRQGSIIPPVPTPIHGICGTAHNQSYSANRTSYAPDTQCASGSPTTTAFPGQGSTINWICAGSNGGTSASCNARRVLPIPSNTPPTVSIISPVSGNISGVVNISATASDDQSVASVQFQVNGVNLGSADTSAPYTIIWNTSDVSAGNYTVGAIARDNGGLTGTAAVVNVTIATVVQPTTRATLDLRILVDQFGYRPADQKVAVIKSPQVGFDRTNAFNPWSLYRLVRSSDHVSVFSANITPWNGGTTQASSGDKGWWFDFSSITIPGSYYVLDVERNLRSDIFRIDQNVYRDILKTATRVFYYQRSGFAKRTPYAEQCWTDDAAYLGANQDKQARDITDRNNLAKTKDLSGGWFDAGDTNKYVTFAASAVHNLLAAYRQSPWAFTDDYNIPESGNGVPDILDEVKWELDWLKKMQYTDGSLALKVGVIEYRTAFPPSTDTLQRYYIPSCTSSTIAGASMFAHAASVYGSIPSLQSEANDLKARAIKAWNNYQATASKQTNCDSGEIKAGDADWSTAEQAAHAVTAAVYLYAITGEASYHSFIKNNYRLTRPYNDAGWSRYRSDEGGALLFYTTLPNADSGLKATIRSDKANDAKSGFELYGFRANDDLYRNFLHSDQYHWGSNFVRAEYGASNTDVLNYTIPVTDIKPLQMRAIETLHYFHGVNPFGIVYLTNMNSLGAISSVNEIYHNWFAPGSKWINAKTSLCGPAPGYVPGGPNKHALADGVPASLTPPAWQPEQKSFRDWGNGWPESSWVVSEPGIYYQAAYIKLLAGILGQ